MTRSPARRVRGRVCAVLVAGLLPNILCLRVNAQDVDQATYHGRRERLAHLAKEGIVVVQTAPHLQAGLTESFIDDSDNHDFLYLTGIETPSGTVLLMPQSTDVPEVLFVPADQVDRIRTETGVKTVMPQEALETVLSEALTDYSLKRMTERRHKLVSTEMARVLSLGQKKVFYFNYPRYLNVSGDPPARVRLASRVQLYSPDVQLRNATPLLTSLRERHDKAELALHHARREDGGGRTHGGDASLQAWHDGCADRCDGRICVQAGGHEPARISVARLHLAVRSPGPDPERVRARKELRADVGRARHAVR